MTPRLHSILLPRQWYFLIALQVVLNDTNTLFRLIGLNLRCINFNIIIENFDDSWYNSSKQWYICIIPVSLYSIIPESKAVFILIILEERKLTQRKYMYYMQSCRIASSRTRTQQLISCREFHLPRNAPPSLMLQNLTSKGREKDEEVEHVIFWKQWNILYETVMVDTRNITFVQTHRMLNIENEP